MQSPRFLQDNLRAVLQSHLIRVKLQARQFNATDSDPRSPGGSASSFKPQKIASAVGACQQVPLKSALGQPADPAILFASWGLEAETCKCSPGTL